MIVIDHVSKHYGKQTAVDDLSFEVKPVVVTGFLGPNGAGKSTTMRMIIGLDRPSSGQITVNGRRYADLRAPLHEVGALLEAKAVHPSRSARDHLLAVATTTGIPTRRVDETLDLVGLTSVANRRAGTFSLGMPHRRPPSRPAGGDRLRNRTGAPERGATGTSARVGPRCDGGSRAALGRDPSRVGPTGRRICGLGASMFRRRVMKSGTDCEVSRRTNATFRQVRARRNRR